MGSWDQKGVNRFHMNLRVATGKGLEETPTCDPDIAADLFIRENIRIRVARNFQGPASMVWGDGRSCQSVLMSTSPATYNPLGILMVGGRESLTQRVKFIDQLLYVDGTFLLSQGKQSYERSHGTEAALSLPMQTPQDLEFALQRQS